MKQQWEVLQAQNITTMVESTLLETLSIQAHRSEAQHKVWVKEWHSIENTADVKTGKLGVWKLLG